MCDYQCTSVRFIKLSNRIELFFHDSLCSSRRLAASLCVVSSRPTTTTTTTSATATTTTTTTTRTTERDACATWTCHHGASCVLEHRRPRCVCPPYNCSTAAGDEGLGPVCGTDRRDYDSECEMTAASCTLQKHIGKLYDGHCGTCRIHYTTHTHTHTHTHGNIRTDVDGYSTFMI